MDDLDRMFRRLVQNIRNGYPELLSQPFEVSELFQSLVPYRHNRKELEIDTNEDYEIALCQMLAGERGLMMGDDVMRETIREELASPNPNTAIYREFAASRVVLVADAVRRADAQGGPMDSNPQPRASGAAVPPRPSPPPPPPPPRASSPNVPPPPPGARSSGPMRAPMPSPPASRPSTPVTASPPAGDCRFCGGALPAGRRVIFCPNCGQNLAIQRCPACGSELEVNWKFCVTCGRSAGAAP
jgi:predicted RNA-binding Zn-ribbon protein involved in translation (DUF1610 family)